MSDEIIHLDVETCQAVVDDLYSAYDLIDVALAHTLRTGAKMIEAGRQAHIEPKRSQKIVSELTGCANAIAEGRKGLVLAHGLAHRIRMDSTVADAGMIGCPAITPAETGRRDLHLVSQAA